MLLLLLASATPPSSTMTGIDPAEGPVGTHVVVSGSNFAEGETILLGSVPLDNQALEGPSRITGDVPGGIAGKVDLELKRQRGGMKLMGAFKVVPKEVQACEKGVVTAASLMTDQRRIEIDRTLPSGAKETVGVKWGDVREVEFEKRKLSSGETCTAIFLHTREGRRVLFDDSTSNDLLDNAKSVAGILGKPLTGAE